MPRWPLIVYWHRDFDEFFAEGFRSGTISDLCRQLKTFGYADSQPIEVIDAATDERINVQLADQAGVIHTIGQATMVAPMRRIPLFPLVVLAAVG